LPENHHPMAVLTHTVAWTATSLRARAGTQLARARSGRPEPGPDHSGEPMEHGALGLADLTDGDVFPGVRARSQVPAGPYHRSSRPTDRLSAVAGSSSSRQVAVRVHRGARARRLALVARSEALARSPFEQGSRASVIGAAELAVGYGSACFWNMSQEVSTIFASP
jgi:hypothetical protein